METITPDGAFAYTAEIKRSLTLDRVGYLGVAIARAVLEVVTNPAVQIQSKDEAVSLGSGLKEFRQAHYNFSEEGTR